MRVAKRALPNVPNRTKVLKGTLAPRACALRQLWRENWGEQAADVDELCTSLDWLLPRQNRIKNKLAKPHPEDGEDEARLVKPTELIPIEAHFLELLEPRA